jgi:predicted Zn-dependent peptidase
MKYKLFYITVALAGLFLAQTGLKAQEKPAYEMKVDGVKVIVQPVTNEIVEIQTVIKGGVQNYPAEKAGIESLAMNALTECGTSKDDKNSFKNKLEKVSANVYGSADMEKASLNLNCIKSDLDAVWPLYVDALTSPLFDAREFERIRQDAINELKSSESQPDNAVNKYARKLAFPGKDYSKDPEGTEATVGKLTVEETKAYYKSILSKSRIVIVVVGDLDKATIEARIHSLLARVPMGKPFAYKKQSFPPSKTSFSATPKEFATNYILGISGGPHPGDPDFNAYMLAMRIFSQRHFVEVRTKNGLSYAPQAWYKAGNLSYAGVSVSTKDPNKYIEVEKALVDKTKKEGFTADELKNVKSSYLTAFYYRQETNAAQAASIVSNEVLFNNWRRSMTIKTDLNKVSIDDVNRVFSKYMNNITWAYMGDPSKVDPKLYSDDKEKPKLPPSNIKTGPKKG